MAAAYPPIYYQRVAAARNRLGVVLARRRVAYYRELERQVCEVGFDFRTAPQSQRPEPVHFTVALKAAEQDGEVYPPIVRRILNTPVRFYALTDTDPDDIEAGLEQKAASVTAYLRVEKNAHISGYHAEA